MNQDKLNAIREACIKANPEIVELKAGCLLEWEGEVTALTGESYKSGNIIFMVLAPAIKGVDSYATGDAGWKVFGRPIRLADILLTLNEKTAKGGYGVCADGRFVYLTGDAGENYFNFFPTPDAKEEVAWDLKRDFLEEQAPETIDFIHSLVV